MEFDPLQILNSHVHRTWDTGNHDESWRNLPEVPTIAEIMPKEENGVERSEEENWDDYQNDPIYDPKLPKNIIDGPWPSKEDYIGAHYQILREDAVAPLRESIKNFKQDRNMNDNGDTCIYTHVHFKGFNLSPFGAAFRIEFSTERAGKQIRWEQSKRLMQGTMVALSPANDMFERVCKIAVVAARPIAHGLDQNPPKIDLFWGDPTDVAFDPVEPYIMIEARTGYLEAYRHVLVGLQKLRTERFSLANHIVHLDPEIGPPRYLKEHSILDLSSLVLPESNEAWNNTTSDETNLQNVDVLEGFPAVRKSGMDASQTSALKRMITKRVAIVQGPPGTGKTFTSVSSLKVLLNNLQPDDPPVIIAAQTNHALDQLIKHVQVSEESIVRLGSRCDKENVDIIKRTLYELRKTVKNGPSSSRDLKGRKMQLEQHINKIQLLMSPLLTTPSLTDEILMLHGLITEEQHDSLYEPGWYDGNQSQREGESNLTSISAWLGEGALIPIPQTPLINLGLPLEEADLEFEQLQELEHELEGAEIQEDKERDVLWGKWLPFLRQFTGKASSAIDYRKIKKVLGSHENLYDIPEAWRGSIYRYWEKQINKDCLARLKVLLVEYQRIIDDTKVTKWNSNIKLIRHLGTKLIGCTTTGLSKYRPLIAALQPRTLLIEEAAETLEGLVMAGMFDSLEHLILVGDHKQLQAHCSVKALEGAPYHMGVSLFERLVSNSMGFTMLNVQRRMISDIRQLLCISPEPFYQDLHDHPSVEDRLDNRAPIPGMGGRDSYFFHHTWPETRGSDLSRHNQDEAEMIVGLFQHLVLNGMKHCQITVLTFYNGQRKTILRELKKHPGLRGNTYFNVFTVDSYQGEENDVILLSLVRSNEALGIGFLESRNRLVVALSRARRGLYIFGNAITLTASETSEIGYGRDVLWTPVINFMKSQGRFYLDGGLPITCSKHETTLSIMEADEWLGLAGGCDEDCSGVLPCGHDCPLRCHPFDHDMVFCRVACPKILPCGHGCSHFCSEVCQCSRCEKVTEEVSGHHTNPIIGPSSTDARENFTTSRHFPKSTPNGYGSGTPYQWQNWNAQKADADMAEVARQANAQKPSIDYSKINYKDTWRAVSLENGERAISAPQHRFINRIGTEDQPTTREVSAAPKIQGRAMDSEDASCDYLVAQLDRMLMSGAGDAGEPSASKPTAATPKAAKDSDEVTPKSANGSSTLRPIRLLPGEKPVQVNPLDSLSSEEMAFTYPQLSYVLRDKEAPLEAAPKAALDENEDLIDLGDDIGFSPAIASDASETAAPASASEGTHSGDDVEYLPSRIN